MEGVGDRNPSVGRYCRDFLPGARRDSRNCRTLGGSAAAFGDGD